ncbi:hypothetical protein TSUD_102110 [Trifolium subterraneum]|uniref:Late embryogenesis abundant protein LEA-2 subgroup domain-containing protein n=1 Tax=Trifolium subterraneum TaxID=3900 RepID=A0A2Z6NAS6_TRISU|nr:hypothetical protein TSUD_102110 [Trifolium subterraneum]
MAAKPNDCCSCCSGFIITMGLTSLFIWLSLKVDEPHLFIDQIYIPTLNKTLNSKSNTSLIFTLKLVNPNKDKGLQYDAVHLNFSVFTNENLIRAIGNGTVERFYQGHEKKAKKIVTVNGAGNLTERVNGKVYLRVDYVTAVKYKILVWYSKRDHLWGGANVEIGDLGLKVGKKGVRLGGNVPVKIVSGGVKPRGGYRALMVFFVVFVALVGFT